ncbi:MAG: hypothetical protein SPI49_02390 [Eubacteriales bacterium]|nr:hypothetical protein [Eubacteriales bacterium]
MTCEAINDYDDIINLEHHVSNKRTPMPMSDRAAQFAPFAALEGHGSAIEETARITENRHVLHDDELELLNEKLLMLEKMDFSVPITIEYFIEDETKYGGKYISICEKISRINSVERFIEMESGLKISIDGVLDIKSDIFSI